MEALLGSALGGYKLTRCLGSGPTGETYGALDSASASAAIKVIHSGLSLFTRAEALWNELRQVGRLAHPHITVASGADWSKSGRFFLTIDLLQGLGLDEVLTKHGRLPAGQALLVVGQVCLALEAAHEAGLVHGALKPRNIFLVPHGDESSGCSTRVLDFGSRCLLGAPPSPGTPGSPGVPEPAYLAPEQFRGAASAASDIYALGVILFEVISGRRPFVGSYTELARAHAQQPLEIPSNIDAGLAEVLRRALAKSPAERYQSVTALREALEGWAAGEPAALEEPLLALFPKEGEDGGVEEEGDQTIRVSVDELSESVMSAEPEGAEPLFEPPPDLRQAAARAVAPAPRSPAAATELTKGQAMSDAKKPSAPEDRELAAIAEKAASPLRSRPESAAAAVASSRPVQPVAASRPVEAYLDEDDDLVELPLEKSVRAFVANLLPVTPPPRKTARPGGNGESLESALDQFVQEARNLHQALPPPVVDDRRLAELAKVPVIEEPAPAPIVVSAPVSSVPPQPPARRSVLLPSLLSFVIGGALVFGGYKLWLEKRGPGAVSSTAPAAALPQHDLTAQPPAGSAATAATVDAAPGKVTPAAAAAGPDATTAGDAAASAPAAAASADAAAARPVVEPEPPKVVAKKKVRKPVAKKEGVAVRPKRPPKKKAPEEKKGKKGGSDWVDPFSQ